MARTALFSRKTPGGVFVIDDYADHSGEIYFVNSASTTGADAAGYGKSPDAPCLTVEYVFANMAAAGDTIYVAEGHNEGSSAVIFDADVAGVKVIGLGTGSRRPTFDYDNAAATIDIGANDVVLKNLVFRPSVTGVLIGVDIETGVTGVTLDGCEWVNGEDGAGTDEFVKALHLTSGNHDTTMRNLRIRAHASAANATHGIHVDAASDRCVYENVVIDGPYATNGILEDAASADTIVVNCSVDVTGTNYGFDGSTTFARRSGNIDAGAPEDTGANLIGVNDSNNTADTSNVAANEDGSVLERLEQIQEAVNIGSGTSLAANKSLVDALGSTGSAITRTVGSNIAGEFLALPRCVEKSDGTVTAGAGDNLFTITGGPVVCRIYGLVTSAIEAGAANIKLQITTTTPAATVDMSAGAVDIDADAAGTSYRHINTTAILTPVTAGFVMMGNAFATQDVWFFCPIGTILCLSDAAKTGTIKWYCEYVPLSPSSLVAAAA